MMKGTCLDLGVGQNLTITDAPSAPYFSRLQGERVEQNE